MPKRHILGGQILFPFSTLVTKHKFLCPMHREAKQTETFLQAKFGVRAAGCVTFFWLVGGEQGGVSGILCSAWSYQPPPGWGPQFLQKSSKVLLCIFLQEEPGPCHKAALLFLKSLPSLISNHFNLPFGTQGKPKRLKEAYFLQTGNGRWTGFVAERTSQSPAQFHPGRLRSGYPQILWVDTPEPT